MLLARREAPLAATADRLYGVDVITIVADMGDFENVRDRIGALTVPIGLLVYDAAHAPIGRFEDLAEKQLASAVAVNVRAPLLLAKLLCGPMIERARGGILLGRASNAAR